MRKRSFVLPLAGVLALAACDGTDPDEERFHADLSGANEIPAPRTTPATGEAQFTVREDGTVAFTLDAANITNVTAAHIHAPAGASANIGVVVTLFTSSPATDDVDGELSAGTFTQADRDGQGTPVASMDSILHWMRTGRAYVNVHTNDGVEPTNTGPGDFPGGEIRGQIMQGS